MVVFAKGVRVMNLHQDDESWGTAFTFSVIFHAGLAAILLLTSKPDHGGGAAAAAGPILTEVNFVEKPAPEAPIPVPAAPEAGVPDTVAQSPTPSASSVVAFGAAGPAQSAQPVAAPIIAAPILPAGEIGGVGMKKAALAPLASARDMAPSKRGPLAMPTDGGGARLKGTPIALNTQGVDDIRRTGGTGIPLMMASAGTGVGAGGKPMMDTGGGLTAPRKAPVEALKANPIERDVWGKKQSPFSMEGPLKYRKIKSMQMPPYPRWAEEQGIEASVSFRLWVDYRGKVKDSMILEKTSGHAELDGLAKEALLRFVFVPIPEGAGTEDEWGVATFRFELKK